MKWLKNLINFCIVLHFIFNIIATFGFAYISRLNYPGAAALVRLHELENKDTRKHIEIILFCHFNFYLNLV